MEAEVPDLTATADPRPGAPTVLREVGILLAVLGVSLTLSERLGGFTFAGAVVGWLGVMLSAALALLFLRRRGTALAGIGLGRPRSWPRTILQGVVVAALLLIVGGAFLQFVVVPLVGSPPDTSRFREGLTSLPMLLAGLFAVWTAAAFGEEIVMRGFVMSRLAGLFGGGRGAWIGALVVSSVLFGALHFYQGAAGIAITGVIGFLIGAAYLALGRNLWVVIFAHGLVDTISFVSVYLAARGGGA